MKRLLLPISFLYSIVLFLRHKLYDWKILKSKSYDIPNICVGNLNLGGTGKTPHIEYLTNLLSENYKIAILSRGYGRDTKGFILADESHTHHDIGDEPLQYFKKFKDIKVAVDENRCEGMERLLQEENPPQVVLLDDAYQHRKIKPSVSVMLVNYNRPTFKDSLMPIGKLRDLPERTDAADIIIVSKCPPDLNGWEKSKWAEALKISNRQHIFFTKTSYDTAVPVFPEGDSRYVYSQKLVLFSGIANDLPLRHYLSSDYKIVRHLKFPDHHKFSSADIREIEKVARTYPTAVFMTTEKDCQRIRDCRKISDNLK